MLEKKLGSNNSALSILGCIGQQVGRLQAIWARGIAIGLIAFVLTLRPSAAEQSAPAATPRGKAAHNFAVVDGDFLISQTQAAQSIRKQYDNVMKRLKTDAEERDRKLRLRNEQLQKLPQDDPKFEKEYKNLDDLIKKEQRLEAERHQALNEVFQRARVTLLKVIENSIESYAQEHSLDAIYFVQALAYHKKAHDITKDITAIINRKLPTIKVEINRALKGAENSSSTVSGVDGSP